jgi:hypothetical protein
MLAAEIWRYRTVARKSQVWPSAARPVLPAGPARASPDPVQAVPDRGEDAADVLAERVERIEIVEDAGEPVLDSRLLSVSASTREARVTSPFVSI